MLDKWCKDTEFAIYRLKNEDFYTRNHHKSTTFATTIRKSHMRVLLINTSERIGGAAVAASRLMEALKNNGIKAKLLVRDKQTEQITVVALRRSWKLVWKFVWERIVIWKANRFKKNNLLPWTSQTQALTSPPCPNSNRPTLSTFIGSTRVCSR